MAAGEDLPETHMETAGRGSIREAKHDDPRFDGAWKAKTKLLALDLKLYIHSEPFGRRGVCIDVWQGDVKLGFRKSWKAAYALALTALPLHSAAPGAGEAHNKENDDDNDHK